MNYFVYMIQNEKLKTYCGFTVNTTRRLRQHNKEIKGGAKATRDGTWKYIFQMTGFKTYNNALSCEWQLKRYRKKLNQFLCLDKWTNKCNIENKDCEYTIYMSDELIKLIHTIPDNMKILHLDE